MIGTSSQKVNRTFFLIFIIVAFQVQGCSSDGKHVNIENSKIVVRAALKNVEKNYNKRNEYSLVYGDVNIKSKEGKKFSFYMRCLGLEINGVGDSGIYIDSMASMADRVNSDDFGVLKESVYWVFKENHLKLKRNLKDAALTINKKKTARCVTGCAETCIGPPVGDG